MSVLIVIFGPPAVGKAAVGYELAKITGYRLFHNHLTADPVAALVGYESDRFRPLADQIRLQLFAAAVDEGLDGVIFTFGWDLDTPSDRAFIDQARSIFESNGGATYFVELVADLQTRLSREGTPLRLALKPTKRDVEAARSYLREIEGQYKLNSNGDFFYPDRHLVLDTRLLDALAAALAIAQRFDLPCNHESMGQR